MGQAEGKKKQFCQSEDGSYPLGPQASLGKQGPAVPRAHNHPIVSHREGVSVTGLQALLASTSQLLLPAHKFNFQRPLCTSGDYEETRAEERKGLTALQASTSAPSPSGSLSLLLLVTNDAGDAGVGLGPCGPPTPSSPSPRGQLHHVAPSCPIRSASHLTDAHRPPLGTQQCAEAGNTAINGTVLSPNEATPAIGGEKRFKVRGLESGGPHWGGDVGVGVSG